MELVPKSTGYHERGKEVLRKGGKGDRCLWPEPGKGLLGPEGRKWWEWGRGEEGNQVKQSMYENDTLKATVNTVQLCMLIRK